LVLWCRRFFSGAVEKIRSETNYRYFGNAKSTKSALRSQEFFRASVPDGNGVPYRILQLDSSTNVFAKPVEQDVPVTTLAYVRQDQFVTAGLEVCKPGALTW